MEKTQKLNNSKVLHEQPRVRTILREKIEKKRKINLKAVNTIKVKKYEA